MWFQVREPWLKTRVSNSFNVFWHNSNRSVRTWLIIIWTFRLPWRRLNWPRMWLRKKSKWSYRLEWIGPLSWQEPGKKLMISSHLVDRALRWGCRLRCGRSGTWLAKKEAGFLLGVMIRLNRKSTYWAWSRGQSKLRKRSFWFSSLLSRCNDLLAIAHLRLQRLKPVK